MERKQLANKIDSIHMSLTGQLWILAGIVFLVNGTTPLLCYSMMVLGAISIFTAIKIR